MAYQAMNRFVVTPSDGLLRYIDSNDNYITAPRCQVQMSQSTLADDRGKWMQ